MPDGSGMLVRTSDFSGFVAGDFNDRRPYLDLFKERLRVAAYRQWLEANKERIARRIDRSELVAAVGAHRLLAIATVMDADAEAAWMDHSIGHSFKHYTGIGDLYSLRKATGEPVVTFLVKGSEIVHARMRNNAPLTPETSALVDEAARILGCRVLLDEGSRAEQRVEPRQMAMF